jgi:hypothetical protein
LKWKGEKRMFKFECYKPGVYKVYNVNWVYLGIVIKIPDGDYDSGWYAPALNQVFTTRHDAVKVLQKGEKEWVDRG